VRSAFSSTLRLTNRDTPRCVVQRGLLRTMILEMMTMSTARIRFSVDGSVCLVWADGQPLRVPTQHDMDTLPVGDDLTADELAGLDD
jgi:hypothetical protein